MKNNTEIDLEKKQQISDDDKQIQSVAQQYNTINADNKENTEQISTQYTEQSAEQTQKQSRPSFKELFSLSFLKDFKWYEWLIIAIMSLSQLVLTIVSKTAFWTALFNYSITLAGFLYVVCASRCSFWIFIFGFYQPIAYGLVCLNSGIYGEMAVNFFYFAPMQIIGICLWIKNLKKDNSPRSERLEVKTLKSKHYLFIVPAVIAVGVALYFILSLLNGQRLPYLDATISVLCILGTMLLTLRYMENWYVYLLVNTISSILWLLFAIDGDVNAPYMLILYIAYTIYSVIGLIKWHIYSKANKVNQSEKISVAQNTRPTNLEEKVRENLNDKDK